MQRRRLLAAAAALPALARASLAAGFPDRTVTMVVPFPPGGGTDVLARLLAAGMTAAWGQTVVVENRPGAAGKLGSEQVARMAPDGHALLLGSTGSALAMTGVAQARPIATSLAPVTLVVAPAYLLVVGSETGITDVAGLVAVARARPGQLAFGSSGVGAASHLAGESFALAAGVELLHVPYRGTGPALNDLIGGRLQLMFAPPQTAAAAIGAGRARAIGITSEQPSPLFPGLPTVAATVPGYSAVGWFGLFAPPGTPAPLLAQIQQVSAAILDTAESRRRLAELGAVPEPLTPAAFAAYVDADLARWRGLIQARHIPME